MTSIEFRLKKIVYITVTSTYRDGSRGMKGRAPRHSENDSEFSVYAIMRDKNAKCTNAGLYLK